MPKIDSVVAMRSGDLLVRYLGAPMIVEYNKPGQAHLYAEILKLLHSGELELHHPPIKEGASQASQMLQAFITQAIIVSKSLEQRFLNAVITVNGKEIDANQESLVWLDMLLQSNKALENTSDTVDFVLADNTVAKVTYADLLAYRAAIQQYLLDIRSCKHQIKAQLEAVTMIDLLPSELESSYRNINANFVKIKGE